MIAILRSVVDACHVRYEDGRRSKDFIWRLLAAGLVAGGFLPACAQNATQTSNFMPDATLYPQVIGSGTSTRLPTMFRATLSGLSASTTYRYYVQGVISSDFGTTQSGGGNPMLVNAAGSTFTYTTGPSLTSAGNYETFTTDASGTYSGWFGFVYTGNARFAAGNQVYPCITIGNTSGTVLYRWVPQASSGYFLCLAFSTSAGANNGTGIRGTSSATAKNFIALYDATSPGSTRPLAVTYVESEGTSVASAPSYYGTSGTGPVDGTAGAWGTIIPNTLANGVRRLAQYDNSGNLVAVNTDSDGSWPTGPVNTVNPSGGSTTPLVISATDAPLNVAKPATQASAVSFNTVGTSSMTVTWSSGSGGNRIVLVKQGSAVDSNPVEGLAYSASATFGNGTQIGTGNYVAYAGNGSSFTLSGLSAATAYSVAVYEYNGSGGSENYKMTPATGSQTTAAPSVTLSGSLTALTTTYGTASAAHSLTIAGADLAAALTATAPTGVEVSSDGTTYASTATFVPSSGTVNGTLHVRLATNAAVTGNYNAQALVLASGTLSTNVLMAPSGNAVSAAVLSITASNQAKPYGATLSPGSAAFWSSGLVNGETVGSVALTANGGTNANASATTYTITPSAATGGTFTPANYAISYSPGTLTVSKATPTVTITDASTYTVDGNPQGPVTALVPAVGGGDPPGGSVSWSYAGTGATLYGPSTNRPVAAGSYLATASYPGDANYNSADSTATAFTLDASPMVVVAGTLAAVNTIYGTASASPSSFTVSGSSLTEGILITPPAGYEVSLSVASGYAAALTLGTGGGIPVTTLYVRLAATTAAGSYAGNIVCSSAGAVSQYMATASSTVSQKPVAITGLSADAKVYDRGTNATLSGTATLSGVLPADSGDLILAGTPAAFFADGTVGTAKPVTVSGFTLGGSAAPNYSLAQPASLTADIQPKPLTVAGATVSAKTYDGSTGATLAGAVLVGVISPEVVTVSGGGTFASAGAGTGIAVTASLSLGGADAGHYSLVQPAGLTGDIIKAGQSISFGALANRTATDTAFDPGATASSGLAVSYASSNPGVASISNNLVVPVAVGSSVITATQAGDANHLAATPVQQTLTVVLPPPLADDFNRATLNGGSQSYTVTTSTGGGNAYLTNNLLEISNGAPAGWTSVAVTPATGSGYSAVLDSCGGVVTWTFNMRFGRTGNTPSGFTSGNYGSAFVLQCNSNDFSAAGSKGYAVLFGNSGSPDTFRLVAFTNGITVDYSTAGSAAGNALITGTGAFAVSAQAAANDYYSFQVTYDPAGKTWMLYGRDDGASAFADPASTNSGSFTTLGTFTETTDLFRTTALGNVGAYWSYNSAAGNKSQFDNFGLRVALAANLAESFITNSTAFTEPSSIDYASYQSSAITGTNDALELARFTIVDGGADGFGTRLTSLRLSLDNSSMLRTVAISDGTTVLAQTNAGATVSFTGLTGLVAADGSSREFSVLATFAAAVTDHAQVKLSVSNAVADVAGSMFAAADAGGAATSLAGNRNRIAVTATRLVFTSVAASCNVGQNFTATVQARDGNNNLDLDCAAPITLSLASGGGTLSSATGLAQAAVAGVASWSDLRIDQPGTLVLHAGASGLTAADSGAITATSVATVLAVGDLSILGFNANAPDNFDFVTWVDLNPGTVIKFTDNGFLSGGSAAAATNARGGEEFCTWTNSTGAIVPAGTVITLQNSGSSPAAASLGSAFQRLNNLSASGDQIFAYQGAGAGTNTLTSDFGNNANPATFTGTILFGFNFGSLWSTNGIPDSSHSFLPQELASAGGNLELSTASTTHGQYTGDRTHQVSFAAFRAMVDNPANWTSATGAGTYPLDMTAFTLGSGAAPDVVGPTSASVQDATALLGATLSNTNGLSVTEWGVFYSTNHLSGASGVKASQTGTRGTGSFLVAVGGLSPATTYFFRGFAINAAGTNFTTEGNFMTLSPSFLTAGNLVAFSADNATTNNSSFSLIEIGSSTPNQAVPIHTIQINGTNGPGSLRTSGSATSTGYLALSDDGGQLMLTAYNTTNASGNINTCTTRAVVSVNSSGTLALRSSYTGVSGQQSRGASTLDRVTWFAGDQGGIYTNNSLSSLTNMNARSIKAYGGTLYALCAQNSNPLVLTLSASGAVSGLPGIGTGTGTNQDFCLVSSGINGGTYDILYVLDANIGGTAGTLRKYSLVSGVWVVNGECATGAGGFGLCAARSGNGAALYWTTGAGNTPNNSIMRLTDTEGYNTPLTVNGPDISTLYTVTGNATLKGLAFTPNTLLASEPGAAPTSLAMSELAGNRLRLSWSPGGASQVLVVMRQGGDLTADPVDGMTYMADANFEGSGSLLGGGKVVFTGAGSSVTVSGLTSGETYYVHVYSYSGTDGSDADGYRENYRTDAYAHGSQTLVTGTSFLFR